MLGILLGISISLYGQSQTKDPGAATSDTTTTQALSTRPVQCTSKPSRKKIHGKIRELSLTRMKPSATNVGWDRFRINDSPDKQSPIINGKVCRAFLYAHADSTLLYTLPKWAKSFSATGFSFESKDVKFIVRCGGKVLYESNLLAETPDKITPIDIDLPTETQEIELIARGVPHNGHAHKIASCRIVRFFRPTSNRMGIFKIIGNAAACFSRSANLIKCTAINSSSSSVSTSSNSRWKSFIISIAFADSIRRPAVVSMRVMIHP
jgi:hypothetical protein